MYNYNIYNIGKSEVGELRRRANYIGLAGVMFCVFSLATSSLIGYISKYFGAGFSEYQSKFLLNEVYMSVSTFIAVPIPFIICAKCCGLKISDCMLLKKPKISVAAVTMPLSIVALGGASLLLVTFVIFLSALGINLLPADGVGVTPTGGVASATIFVLAISPITGMLEEFIFRGIVFTTLRKFGDHFAVFASAFIFAIMHGNPLQSVNAFFFGTIMGYLVLITGSLWPTIILHAINNFVVSASLVFSVGTYMIVMFFYIGILIASAITAFIVFLFYFKDYKKNIRLFKNKALSNPKKFITYLTAPIMILCYLSLIYIENFDVINNWVAGFFG